MRHHPSLSRFLRWAAPLGAVLLTAQAAPPPPVPGAEHVAICREKGRYCAFPVLYLLPDEFATLYVRFGARVTSSHLEPRQEPMAFASSDGGRTWTRARHEKFNPAWQSSPGCLVEPGAYGWRYVDPGQRAGLEARGIEVRDSPDGRITYAYGCRVRASADAGSTWSEREIAVPAEALIMSFLDPATYLRLDRNTILQAVYGKPKAGVRFYESWLLRSEDDGAAWKFLPIAADPRGQRSFGETALARAADGAVVAMMRTEPALGSRLWTARSTDGGRTWGPARETPLLGHPAHLLLRRDGSLLCTYGYREGPMEIRAALSRDGGCTWRAEDIVVLRTGGTGRPADNGYPITVELPGGELFTAYYFTRSDGITGIEGTRWRAPWPVAP